MAASKYEFRIRGRLSATLLARFDPLESDVERVETVLHGRIRDQAELHGVLERVQALGLELIEVRRLPDSPAGVRPRRTLGLALTALMLYGVAPAVVDVLGGWRDLDRLSPGWWAAVIATQVAGWGCLWVVQRLALNRAPWFPVATSQLASGALGRVVPGGAAAAGALQYRMLAQSGLAPTAVATGLTAGSPLLFRALVAPPVLAVPALIAGRRIPVGLLEAGGLSLVVFGCLFAIGALLMVSDRAIRWVGRAAAAVMRRVRPRRPAPEDLPERLAVERDLVRRTLGRRWPQALAAAVGRWLFDFLTLQAALEAVGARP